MMEQREKLIDLLSHFHECPYDETLDCSECDYKDVKECFSARLADHLIANGIVILPCRCEKCEYTYDKLCDSDTVWCCFHGARMPINGFCPYAKRKGGDK